MFFFTYHVPQVVGALLLNQVTTHFSFLPSKPRPALANLKEGIFFLGFLVKKKLLFKMHRFKSKGFSSRVVAKTQWIAPKDKIVHWNIVTGDKVI